MRAEPVARAALACCSRPRPDGNRASHCSRSCSARSASGATRRRELFDLEAGVAPASLRRQLRLRASLAGLAGALGGIATGVVLSLLVVRFVELTANATSPEPPLELVPDWPLLAVAGVLAAITAVALVGAATWRAFRGRVPARYGGAA